MYPIGYAYEEYENGDYLAESDAGTGMRPSRVGGVAQPVYLFTGEQPKPSETRREALARMITKDRQFARNIVNRIWAELFGSGFVTVDQGFDPARISKKMARVNKTTVQAKQAKLMERLTDYFIDSNFNARLLMKEILGSILYQIDYKNLPATAFPGEGPYFGGKQRVRRLDAESIIESAKHVFKATANGYGGGWKTKCACIFCMGFA